MNCPKEKNAKTRFNKNVKYLNKNVDKTLTIKQGTTKMFW